MAKALKQKITEVDLSRVDPPKEHIRRKIDPEYISELAKSISEIGLLQPVLLRPDGERYEVVAGHCRFLAHKQIEAPTIRAIVRVMTDQETAVARATENLGRVDLSPIEEAATYINLVDVHGMTVDQVARQVGKTTTLVKRRMDLIRMPPQLQEAVHTKAISISVAEELWAIRDEVQLNYYLSFAVSDGCSRETARDWAKEWKDSVRRASSAGVEGGGVPSPLEPRIIYMSCDLCQGPVELGKDQVLRVCPQCGATIKANM
ncbi:Nucleoid occlusion protein [subsurface metagenome]